MPFPGYLQDLAELIDDCLLPINNQGPVLISDKHSSTASNSTSLYASELSEGTLADLLLLTGPDTHADTVVPQPCAKITESSRSLVFTRESSQQRGYKDPCATKTSTFSTPSTISPQIIDDSDISDQGLPNISPITTISEYSNLPRAPKVELDVPDLRPPSLSCPVQMKEHYSTMPSLSTSQSSEMELDANVGAQLPQTHTTEMDLDTKPEFNFAIFSDLMQGEAHSGPDPSTALAVRTTEDVIADLKRSSARRPAHMDKLSVEGELGLNDSVSNVDDEDEDSDLEDHLPVPKQRKITERKRRLNAVADNFMQERNEKLIKVRDE